MADGHAADVQQELQQYLTSKNINSLFISIVENLLIEKPANPIAFIVEYLYKQYPDQAKVALETIYPNATNGNTTVPVIEQRPVAKVTTTEPVESESESEDDDDVADIPVSVPKARASGNRRQSVSAESMDPNKLKAQMSQVTNIPKSPEVTEKLMNVVSKSALLRTLDPEQKELIVKAFSGPLIKEAGENVIVQGDIGETFFLLEDGTVDVYIKKNGSDEMKVHTYKPGDSFGELAIMYNAPRAATCRVNTTATLWALDRISFKVIVVAAAMHKREVFTSFLKQVPILASLNEMEVNTLADSLAEETYSPNDVVCRQGEEGNYFYIVKDGTAECYQTDASGQEKIVATLTRGNYFGEIALLTSKPRQATVKASGELKVLAIDRATFTRVFGPMEVLMKRNIEEYHKFQSTA